MGVVCFPHYFFYFFFVFQNREPNIHPNVHCLLVVANIELRSHASSSTHSPQLFAIRLDFSESVMDVLSMIIEKYKKKKQGHDDRTTSIWFVLQK